MSTLVSSRIMPRTTFDLDATVLAELRRRAGAEKKSMGQLASELLADRLGADAPEPAPLRWVARDMGPFKIDLEDKEAVAGLLERDELERGRG